ncbi:hypothetical protein GobsT_61550 [Gemmata obscuriglobus]|nr:hypothetical protein GobsT_61550 [Gemmata obscuriglobus]VTS10674.1 unnamed protein product [Gemmata obscuriglobus UQM 2246]
MRSALLAQVQFGARGERAPIRTSRQGTRFSRPRARTRPRPVFVPRLARRVLRVPSPPSAGWWRTERPAPAKWLRIPDEFPPAVRERPRTGPAPALFKTDTFPRPAAHGARRLVSFVLARITPRLTCAVQLVTVARNGGRASARHQRPDARNCRNNPPRRHPRHTRPHRAPGGTESAPRGTAASFGTNASSDIRSRRAGGQDSAVRHARRCERGNQVGTVRGGRGSPP